MAFRAKLAAMQLKKNHGRPKLAKPTHVNGFFLIYEASQADFARDLAQQLEESPLGQLKTRRRAFLSGEVPNDLTMPELEEYLWNELNVSEVVVIIMGNDTMENAKYAHQFGHINFLLWDWALQLSAKNVVRMCIFAQGDGKFQFPRDSDFKDEIQAYEVDLPGATVENRTIRRILKELLQRQWNTDFQLRDRPDDVRTFVCDQWAKFYEFRQQLKIRVKLLRSKVVGRKSLSGTEVLDIIQAIYPFDEKYVCQAHRCLEHHVFLSHRQKFHGKLVHDIGGVLEEKNGNRFPLRPFVDARCLTNGEEWKAGFLTVLRVSSVIVILTNHDLFEEIAQNGARYDDNVLLEWELAQDLHRICKRQLIVFNILEASSNPKLACQWKTWKPNFDKFPKQPSKCITNLMSIPDEDDDEAVATELRTVRDTIKGLHQSALNHWFNIVVQDKCVPGCDSNDLVHNFCSECLHRKLARKTRTLWQDHFKTTEQFNQAVQQAKEMAAGRYQAAADVLTKGLSASKNAVSAITQQVVGSGQKFISALRQNSSQSVGSAEGTGHDLEMNENDAVEDSPVNNDATSLDMPTESNPDDPTASPSSRYLGKLKVGLRGFAKRP